MKNMIPVYICTGQLDSGKTTFIQDTLMEQDWIEPGKTLLIQCEEGDYALSADYRRMKRIDVVTVEEPEQLTKEWMEELTRVHLPVQILIEFNGMWNLQDFLAQPFPDTWGLAGIYSCVDGQSLELMMNNMRNLFLNQLIESDLIVINRCRRDMNRVNFRKALKLQNPGAQLIFEAEDGQIIEFSEEDLPYDLSQSRIELQDVDYGTWYSDAFENPDRYIHKQFTFLAQLFRPLGMPKNMFVPGRLVMACCAADVKFYGFPCKSDTAFHFEQKCWKKVTAEFIWLEKKSRGRQEQMPGLKLIAMEDAEKPAEEVVTL